MPKGIGYAAKKGSKKLKKDSGFTEKSNKKFLSKITWANKIQKDTVRILLKVKHLYILIPE